MVVGDLLRLAEMIDAVVAQLGGVEAGMRALLVAPAAAGAIGETDEIPRRSPFRAAASNEESSNSNARASMRRSVAGRAAT